MKKKTEAKVAKDQGCLPNSAEAGRIWGQQQQIQQTTVRRERAFGHATVLVFEVCGESGLRNQLMQLMVATKETKEEGASRLLIYGRLAVLSSDGVLIALLVLPGFAASLPNYIRPSLPSLPPLGPRA